MSFFKRLFGRRQESPKTSSDLVPVSVDRLVFGNPAKPEIEILRYDMTSSNRHDEIPLSDQLKTTLQSILH